jgi:hypothetical protein
MSFFDDVSSFFGGDAQPEGPISVPLPYDDAAAASDPDVIRAQQDFSIACAREDALKTREVSEQQIAEGKLGEDWMQKAEQAQLKHDSLKTRYESAKTKAEGGDLYEDQKQALYQELTRAYQALQLVKDLTVFKASHPVAKYMNQQFVEELEQAGRDRMRAQAALDAAKTRTASRSR